MLTPAYRLVIGDKKVDTTDEPRASTVERIEVDLDLDAPADVVRLRFGNNDGLKPEEDDEATIELGYTEDDDLTLVLTGGVVTGEPGITVTNGMSHCQKLLDLRHEETFQNKTAGDIVRTLADEAGVTVARAEAGLTFPAYVIDGRRSVYAHMREIADICGFVVFANEDGDLVFRPIDQPASIHVFEFAKHLVELEVERGDATAVSVDVRGESPGTSRGEESWAWLTKDSSGSRGTAGSGAPTLLLEKSVLRTPAATQAAADAAFAQLTSQATRGRLRTFGRPQIRLGDSIRIKDVPDARLNGDFRVRAVRHSIDKKNGFRTEVDFLGVP
jgi:phage protein D